VPQLIEAGYKVFGSTRSSAKAAQLEELGAIPLVVDVFDRSKLVSALRAARPSVVMNQLTDLPKTWSGSLSEETLKANARLRVDGTRNLMAAAISAGVRRLISQSLAWLYAPGPQPHRENDPLDRNPDGPAAASIAGVIALKQLTLGSPPQEGLVLRYGQFYGTGTWNTAQSGPCPFISTPQPTLRFWRSRQNISAYSTSPRKTVWSPERARRELGWSADFRLQSPVLA
jgi:nucleoside-diphosphate-sugar epimerase